MIHLEEIVPTDDQIQTLYELLVSRKHGISHKHIPVFAEHIAFVRDHPYRAWLLVRESETCLGSVYVHKDNTIGVNIDEERVVDCFEEVLNKVLKSYQPLPPVKSVRNAHFMINAAPTNRALISALENSGFSVAQVTYVVGSHE
ncbi:hypothetical protein [Hoeflea sp. TYP-13]|uniref:hypothetical protein n=1 Tax=Hoeflea sp. TYP-13 TaxID=3230023 RepID=UPI0034C6B558